MSKSVEARVGPFASPPQAKDVAHHEMRGDHAETAVHGEVRKHGPFTTPTANKAPEPESSQTTDTDSVPTQAHTEAAKWVRLLGSHGTKSKWVLAKTATVDDNPPLGSVQYPERGLTVLPLLYDIPERDRKHEEKYRQEVQNAVETHNRPTAAPPIGPLTPVQTCGEEGCAKCESAQRISGETYLKTYDEDGVETYDEEIWVTECDAAALHEEHLRDAAHHEYEDHKSAETPVTSRQRAITETLKTMRKKEAWAVFWAKIKARVEGDEDEDDQDQVRRPRSRTTRVPQVVRAELVQDQPAIEEAAKQATQLVNDANTTIGMLKRAQGNGNSPPGYDRHEDRQPDRTEEQQRRESDLLERQLMRTLHGVNAAKQALAWLSAMYSVGITDYYATHQGGTQRILRPLPVTATVMPDRDPDMITSESDGESDSTSGRSPPVPEARVSTPVQQSDKVDSDEERQQVLYDAERTALQNDARLKDEANDPTFPPPNPGSTRIDDVKTRSRTKLLREGVHLIREVDASTSAATNTAVPQAYRPRVPNLALLMSALDTYPQDFIPTMQKMEEMVNKLPAVEGMPIDCRRQIHIAETLIAWMEMSTAAGLTIQRAYRTCQQRRASRAEAASRRDRQADKSRASQTTKTIFQTIDDMSPAKVMTPQPTNYIHSMLTTRKRAEMELAAKAKQLAAEAITNVSGGVLSIQGNDPVSDTGRPISDSAATVDRPSERATLADTPLATITARSLDFDYEHNPEDNWRASDSNPLARKVAERLHRFAVTLQEAAKKDPPLQGAFQPWRTYHTDYNDKASMIVMNRNGMEVEKDDSEVKMETTSVTGVSRDEM